MSPLKAFRRYRAKRQYARKLTPALHRMYGRRRYYKPAQIRAAAKKEELNLDYICWGYAMHLTPQDFSAIHAATGEVCDYAGMRTEMAHISGALHGADVSGTDAGFDIGDFGDGGGDGSD